MNLRVASSSDLRFIAALWRSPQNAMFLTECSEAEIAEQISGGGVFIWQTGDVQAGFASVVNWVPRSFGITELAVAQSGQGHGSAFLTALLQYLFAERGAHRVSLDTTVDNERALSLFRKIGFVQEGVYRQCWQRIDGNWVDCPHFSFLSHEWMICK